MKFRHAAALALVGWYLMAPPVSTYNEGNQASVDLRAPIWQWKRLGTFRSAVDCENAREKSQKKAQHDEDYQLWNAAEMDANIGDWAIAAFEAARQVKCVLKDDPRLKKQ